MPLVSFVVPQEIIDGGECTLIWRSHVLRDALHSKLERWRIRLRNPVSHTNLCHEVGLIGNRKAAVKMKSMAWATLSMKVFPFHT